MPYRFAVPIPLRWADVDAEGLVNNAVYLSLMEQARFLYFERLGLLRAGQRIPFVLAEVNVGYRRPGRFGMRIEVAARVSRLGKTSFAMEYEIRGDGELLVLGRAALVFVAQDQRPEPIPVAVRDAIATFEGLDTGGSG
jgi:acyl-CoA thioester hydrolase